MEYLPIELILMIFALGTSFSRCMLCIVNTKFNKLALQSSRELSKYPQLYDDCGAGKIKRKMIIDIYKSNEYHIIVRKKLTEYKNLSFACMSDDINIIKLAMQLGAKDWDSGLLTAAGEDNSMGVSLMIEKGANKFDLPFLSACKIGSIFIVSMLLNMLDVEHCDTLLDAGLVVSARHNHINLVKYLVLSYALCIPYFLAYFGQCTELGIPVFLKSRRLPIAVFL